MNKKAQFNNSNMKSLIKWAGGKSNEIKYVKKIIPRFDRYIEPFFGGGALFFDLEPEKSVINDISKEFIMFYRLLKSEKSGEVFKIELYNYVEAWEGINNYILKFGDSLLSLYKEYRNDKINEVQLNIRIDDLFQEKVVPFNGLFKKDFCIDQKNLLNKIEQGLVSKLKRTKDTVDVKCKFSDDEIMLNIESAFRSGFYMHFRDIMNNTKKGNLSITREKQIANWYFIREFCYGGMFRFNSNREFNVPYGGIAYNKKDFRAKVDNMFSESVRNLLANTKIENKDFGELLSSLNLTKTDFVFLDPPYDTEFSKYEENPFTKEDQIRLAKILLNMQAKWILIIKETAFIKSLYEGKHGIRMTRFNKTYLFNIKKRFARDVHHLIIHNVGNRTANLNMFV